MKYLYLQSLRLRVWLLRRRLARMGFRANAPAPPRVIPRFKVERTSASGRFTRCLQLLVLILGLLIWIVFYLKALDPAVSKPKDRHEAGRPSSAPTQPKAPRLT